jgi:hypothetical protein
MTEAGETDSNSLAQADHRQFDRKWTEHFETQPEAREGQ